MWTHAIARDIAPELLDDMPGAAANPRVKEISAVNGEAVNGDAAVNGEAAVNGNVSESSTSDKNSEDSRDSGVADQDEEQLPAEQQQPPAEQQETLAEEEQTLAEEQQTVAEEQQTLAEEQQTPAEEPQTVAEEPAAAVEPNQNGAGEPVKTEENGVSLENGAALENGATEVKENGVESHGDSTKEVRIVLSFIYTSVLDPYRFGNLGSGSRSDTDSIN